MKSLCIALLIVFLLPASLAFAAHQETISSSFETVVKKHIDSYKSDPRILVYYIPEHVSANIQAGWRKSKCEVTENYTFAVKETDSLITPYKAYLIYKMKILVSPAFSSKELAETTEDFKESSNKLYKITFSFQDGRWIPEKYEDQFQIERSVPPVWFEIKQNPASSPFKRIVVKDLDSLM